MITWGVSWNTSEYLNIQIIPKTLEGPVIFGPLKHLEVDVWSQRNILVVVDYFLEQVDLRVRFLSKEIDPDGGVDQDHRS